MVVMGFGVFRGGYCACIAGSRVALDTSIYKNTTVSNRLSFLDCDVSVCILAASRCMYDLDHQSHTLSDDGGGK